MIYCLGMNNGFDRGAEGELRQRRTCKRKELVPMVTYADLFQFVIMLCAVITLVVTTIRKK